MVDPLNLLGVAVVPITLLIDEQGIIRYKGDPDDLEDFLALRVTGKLDEPTVAVRPALGDPAAASSSAADRRSADELVLWGAPERLDQAIDAYRRVLTVEPQHGPTHFRLGVAYRQRYDSSRRQPGDFHRAVESWGRALELDPNQYIWRRRIQQYGPRLTKPYPFYDWVETARRDIIARGETPVALPVEPQGAEIASPSKGFAAEQQSPTAPDPAGKIRRDKKGYVEVEVTVVPARLEPGATGRIHAVFRPNAEIQAHWNNEVDGLTLWVDPPPGWQVDRQHLSLPNPPQPVSEEERRLELEIQSPEGASGAVTLPAYALYYVCEDVKGSCLYRRQDVSLQVEIASD